MGTALRRSKVRARGPSSDFRQWLATSSFSGYDFARDRLSGGSFGGRAYAGEPIRRRPVVFVHGNTQVAGSWGNTVAYFKSNGYTDAELYATTWGSANILLAANSYYSKADTQQTRAFMQAVLAYTGAPQIDVVSYSMGVSFARKAILGGWAEDIWDGGWYYLGSNLTSSVHSFVGISGQCRGMNFCLGTGATSPVCSLTAGHWPGLLSFGVVTGRSQYLDDLRDAPSGFEGKCRYSMGSTAEILNGYNSLVYGLYTWRFPGTTDAIVYNYNDHVTMQSQTWITQFNLVNSSC